MSSTSLAALVGLTSFALVSTMLALLVSALWYGGVQRIRLSAEALLGLRLLPSAGAAIVTVVAVVPAFVRFEPRSGEWEETGRTVIALAACGACLLLAGAYRGWCAIRTARALTSGWLTIREHATTDGQGLHVIDLAAPVVAAMGLWRSRVVIARTVLEVCSDEEIARVAAHERAHHAAHDNFKRLVLAASPDLLVWLPAGHAIAERWHGAAERAADERAVGSNREARFALASALVKVARLALATTPAARLVGSRLIGAHDVEDRVRHLIAPGQDRQSSRDAWIPALIVVGLCAAALVRQEGIHAVAEWIVGAWR